MKKFINNCIFKRLIARKEKQEIILLLKIIENICLVKKEIRCTEKTLIHEIEKLEEKIMSKISEFAAKVNAHNDKMDTAIGGLTDDVQDLKDLVQQLQNTQGEITAEDQALLDAIETRSGTIAAKLEALDALTPPPPPVEG